MATMEKTFDASSVTNKDVRKLVQALLAQGHRVEWGGSGHLKVWHKDGVKSYVLANTPRSSRWRIHTSKELQRLGFLYADPFKRPLSGDNPYRRKVGESQRGDADWQRKLTPLAERALELFDNNVTEAARAWAKYAIAKGHRNARARKNQSRDVKVVTDRFAIILRKVTRSETLERFTLDNLQSWLYSLNYEKPVIVRPDPEPSGVMVVVGEALVNGEIGAAEAVQAAEEAGVLEKDDTTEAELLAMVEKLEAQLLEREQELDHLQRNGKEQPYWIKLLETLIDENISAEVLVKVVREARSATGR